ncbi:MAG: hypothetical protein ACRDTI_20845 [Mycobacterium sp.]
MLDKLWVPDGLSLPPLEFTKNLGGLFQDKIIGAVSKPLPINDPISSYRYLRRRGEMFTEAGKQRPLVRMQDENLDQIARIGNEISCTTEEIAYDSGGSSVVIRGGDYLADFVKNVQRIETDLHLSVDPIATNPSWRTRWGGKITNVIAKRDSSGIHTVELQATHQREHLKNILIAANPVFPPELQLPKMWFVPANFRTAASFTLNVQLARLFFPVLNVLTNIANPGAWLDESFSAFNPLYWPQQVAFVNPVLDQSQTSLVAGAWTDFHSATLDQARDAGVIIRSYTFFTEDEDNPHTELEGLVGNDLASLTRPRRNCVVHSFQDLSGHEGPTGTAADGFINLWASTADNLITNTVLRVDEDHDGLPDPVFQKLFGVAPKKPFVKYLEGQHSGIIESQVSMHKGPVKTIMTGSRSPSIVNQAQTFGIRFGLAQLEQCINYGMGAYQQPLTSGLDNLYQGQLDNTLLAWQRFTDPERALFTGDLAWQEHFERGGGTAYTISGVLTLRVGWYKKRAYRSFKVSVRNGAPYVYGVDMDLGHRALFEQDHIFYVEQISASRYNYDRKTPVTYSFSIGDDSRDSDPFLQGLRALQAVYSLAGMFLGEGTIFG